MFENLSYLTLQEYWWIIVSLLAAILVFLLFVQGGQTLIPEIARNEEERSILINSIGRKWDLTFTTLVTFGGAFFASFPLFYSTSFGGAYWVWMAILFSFVIQAVSYEYRTKAANLLGTKVYDFFLLINGLVAPIFIGTAVGTFFTGSSFSVVKENITNISNPVISQWHLPTHGLEAILNVTNLSLGLAIFFLARVLAILYFLNNVEYESLKERFKKHLLFSTIPFLIFFLTFIIQLVIIDGFALNPITGEIFIEKYKYLHNLLEMPMVLGVLLLGVLGVVVGIIAGLLYQSGNSIWYAGFGTVMVVLSVFLLAGFNNTAFYPSIYDLQSSLTIQNASSSYFTLVVMSFVSLLIPFVLAYIWYVWNAINKVKVSKSDLENDSMAY